MKNLPSKTLLALACLQAAPLAANERLEEMTIVSSRVEMPLRQVGTSVSVVTAEDLKIRGFESVANSLRLEPGISVNNNGGVGKATSLRIRGEQSFRTKVFIDGIEVTDTSTPQSGPNFANLSTSGIGRIEILRGPQGMMYGADAGGVVLIDSVTAQDGIQGSVQAEYGRYGTTDFQGNVAGSTDTLDFAVSAGAFDTDGFNTRSDDANGGDDDGYENTTVHGRGGWNISNSLRLEAVGRVVEGDNEFDDCSDVVTFARLDDCSNEYDETAWRVALAHESEGFTNSLSYNSHETEREFFSAQATSFATEGELDMFNYLGSWKASQGLNFVYGAELRKEGIDDGSSDTDRDQEGYFLEYQGSFQDSLYLTLGARYDDNDDFGSETTYRTSAAYLVPIAQGELKFRGSYGTGFRAPSLSEISYNQGGNAFPPASETELSAEKSQGFDLSIAFYGDNELLLEAVYFDQTIDDEIFFDLIDFSGYLQGSGESTSEGVELIAEVPATEDLLLYANYTYNDTEDAEGAQRRRAPKHVGNLGFIFAAMEDKLTLALNLRMSADSPDESDGAVDDYEVVDFSANYQINDALEIFGRIDNLTDEDYQELPLFNTSGAAGYIGVRYNFATD